MSWLNIVVLLLAGVCVLAAVISSLGAIQARSGISHSAYGVARQESRRHMQVALLRAVVFGILALILFGVYGLSVRPDDMLSTEPEPMLTIAPDLTVTQTPTQVSATPTVEVQQTTAPTATSTVAAPTSTATVTATPTIAATPVPSAIVNSEVGLYLRPEPGSNEELELLPNGMELVLLSGRETVDDLEWQQVRAPSGTEGWVAVEFITYQQ